MPRHARRAHALVPAFCATLALAAAGSPAMAVDRLVLTAAQVDSPAAALRGATVSLDLTRARVEARFAHVQVRRAGAPSLDDLRLSCDHIAIDPSELACQDGRVAFRAGALGSLDAPMALDFDPAAHTWKINARNVRLAGGLAQIAGVLSPVGSSLEVRAAGMDLGQAVLAARPWVSLPAGYKVAGHVDAHIALTDRPAAVLSFEARSADLNLTNEPGTVVAQQVALSISGTAQRASGVATVDATVHGSSGQALAGPVLLDLGANPLTLTASLRRAGTGPVLVSRLELEQRGLLRARAQAVVQPGARADIASAHVEIASLEFPAAYTSYLQLALATTQLASLQSSGEARGSLDIEHNAITRLDCSLRDLNFTDPEARVLMRHATGDIHWTAAPGTALAPSNIAWDLAAAYGLSGGPVRLRFATWQRNFALLGGDARLPVFDGAVIVHTLVARDLGTSQAKIDFDADVTPISMPRLSKAFGWPPMNGEVSGRIPLVRYRDRELTFDGDLVAKVFDGTITGSHIVLKSPLGPWPALSANVLARNLDLDLVTHTFAFGSMTGRVDVDVRGLQLFNWSPVAFDARLYTVPGDRSPHLISQNAVTRIAGLGGAAAAVKAALESGVLKFFHTFHYDRIAIGCRLRNEVCGMSGAGPGPRGGYYLVRGSGVPRLDIIGNVDRVDWPRLIGQIEEGMKERKFVVDTGRK